jgi:hypothetical protein
MITTGRHRNTHDDVSDFTGWTKAFIATHPSHWVCSNGAALRRALIAPAFGVSRHDRAAIGVCGGRVS